MILIKKKVSFCLKKQKVFVMKSRPIQLNYRKTKMLQNWVQKLKRIKKYLVKAQESHYTNQKG